MSSNDLLSTFNAQIQLAKNIDSDSEKATVLKRLLTQQNLTDDMIGGITECVGTMYNSKEKADVLQLIAKRPGLSNRQHRMGVHASSSIDGDSHKARTIKAFLAHEQFTVQNLDVVLSATHTIYSSSEKCVVFTELILNRYLTGTHFPSILGGIREVDNDGHKSDVLCKLAPRLPKNDGNVVQAYLNAADSIYSSKSKAAATMAFM